MSSKFNGLNERIIKLKDELELTFDKSTEFYKQANLNVEDLEKIIVKMKEVILKNVLFIFFIII